MYATVCLSDDYQIRVDDSVDRDAFIPHTAPVTDPQFTFLSHPSGLPQCLQAMPMTHYAGHHSQSLQAMPMTHYAGLQTPTSRGSLSHSHSYAPEQGDAHASAFVNFYA